MSTQTKVVEQNGSYIGYLIQNGQVVFTTSPCPNPNAASRLVSEHLNTLNVAVKQPTSLASPPETNNQPIHTQQPSPSPSQRTGGCGCRRG